MKINDGKVKNINISPLVMEEINFFTMIAIIIIIFTDSFIVHI